MNWLARLKKLESAPNKVPTKPTKPAFAGFVGAVQSAFQESAANDETFKARLGLFTCWGVSLEEGQALAQTLAQRDVEQDERKLCLECACLSDNGGHWHCSQWQRIGLIRNTSLPDEWVRLLQRCAGFQERLTPSGRPVKQTRVVKY